MPTETEDVTMVAERRESEEEHDSLVAPLLHDHHSCPNTQADSSDQSRPQSPESNIKETHSKTVPVGLNHHLEVPHVRIRRFSTTSSKRLFTVVNYGNIDDAEVESIVTTPPISENGDINYMLPDKSSPKVTIESDAHSVRYESVMRMLSLEDHERIAKAIQSPKETHVQFFDGVETKGDSLLGSLESMQGNKESNKVYSSWGFKVPMIDVARMGRIYTKRRQERLINKSGEPNFVYKHMESSWRRWLLYLRDIFTTLLDIKWRYIFLLFVMAFILSWLLFALLWWGIAAFHKDTDIDKTEERCVVGVYDFPTALLFSIESQHTIGYGSRSITTACRIALFILMAQSVLGVLIQCIITGIVFAKIARPKGRSETFLFSKKAVVLQRDGHLWLMFRLGDMRRSQFICSNVNAVIVRRKSTEEGEDIPLYYEQLKITTEAEGDFFFMAWPVRVVHKIDPDSPLWDVSAERLLGSDFEIIVVLEGVNESSGMTTQVRTSYLPSEVLWGHRFADMVAQQKGSGLYHIDYTRFHETAPVDMGEYSAKDLFTRRESVRSIKSHLSNLTNFSYEQEGH